MNILIPGLRILVIIAVMVAPARSVLAGGDHHMHIYSDDGARVWAAICDTNPDDCADELPIPTAALTAQAAIQSLDAAGLNQGVLLSLGYFFGAPDLIGSVFDDHRYVRAENCFVARQAARFPDRLVGFFSVNPLKDYAIDEVSHWATHGGLVGLKLHLANSDLDFSDPEHIARLRAVFEVMNKHGLSIVIHLRNLDPDYGYDHAALFIDQVARHAPDVTFQLAHMAGWGGYDDGTDGAVRAFLDAIDSGVLDHSKVWFDIAAVIEPDMPDNVYATLRQRFRRIGFDRLLFASDWDEVEPDSYIVMLSKQLQLSDVEIDQLISNEAPYLRQRR